MKKSHWPLLLIFSIVSLIYSFPIFENISYWGQMDWDQFTFWNAVSRETILRYHQFPLWNPYANGGTILLAHPHSSFLSPFYLFILALGPIMGLKVQIVVYLTMGLLGMFLLARYFELSQSACYLTAFVFMLNSLYALHLSEGHACWMPMSLIPWVFMFYLKSLDMPRHAFGSIIFLGWILLAGGVDVVLVLAVILILFAAFKSIQAKQIFPLRMLAMIFGGAFLLCAVKLLPMLEFLYHHPRVTDESTGTGFLALYKMLLSREQAFPHIESWVRAQDMGLKYGWHEYGCYIGIIPLLLGCLGAAVSYKKQWPLILTGVTSLIIAMGSASPLNLWKVLHSLPVYDSMHAPSRFMLGFVFTAAIFAGIGLTFLEKCVSKSAVLNVAGWRIAALAITLLIFVDLWLVNSPIFKNAFIVPPLTIERYSSFGQRYDKINLHGTKLSHSSMYPVFLSHSGILEAYEIVQVKQGGVRISSDFDYRGEAYLLKSGGKILIEDFSPNRITLDADVKKQDILVINQNFDQGWRIKQNGVVMQVQPVDGLLAVPVTPGHHKLVAYYLPLSFLIGLCVSLAFIFGAAILSARILR